MESDDEMLIESQIHSLIKIGSIKRNGLNKRTKSN